jgi:hypothetical protein
MAYEERLTNISVPASGDLTASQYRFMQINSSGKLALSGTAGRPDGVLQDDPDADGVPGALAIAGVSKVVAGAALAAGLDVTSDSTGRAVAAATGDEVAGTTMGAATGAGSIIPVLLRVQ